MIANRFKPVVYVLACLSLASAATAGERRHHGDGHGPRVVFRNYAGNTFSSRQHRHFVENDRWDRQGQGRRNRPAEADRFHDFAGNTPNRTRRLGGYNGDYYGGSFEAYPESGNGIYFLHEQDYWAHGGRSTVELAPRAKVINVDSGMRGGAFHPGSACSFEAGVCVIRGRP